LIKEISDGDSTGNPGNADDGDKDHVVMTSSRKNDGATGYGKDAARKSQTPDFPSPLGNPANPAGFPLSHSPDDYGRVLKSESSITTKKGDTSNVVRRGTFLMSVDKLFLLLLTSLPYESTIRSNHLSKEDALVSEV
jgi:hypothetical protein